jgi:UDP-2,3-diacylglucosamine hydrolase
MAYGLIAGNGRFPVLALEAARKAGLEIVAIGIKEEASNEIEPLAARCHWISLGQLSKLIEICRREGITQVMMCGQVKHTKIFSTIVPDWRLVKLLASIETRNTEGLIGAIVRVLGDEGIELLDSTLLLKDLLAPAGVLTRRKPSADEERDIDYGRRIAAALSEHDIGQSVAIAERACVAVEAMEGTDAMLRRAASLVEGKPLRLVKGSRRRQHMLYDVPVAGPQTIRVMSETGTTALAIDAGRTLLLDRDEFVRLADAADIAVVAHAPENPGQYPYFASVTR